ncbi:chemotaxis response regulator protein-glutamate methylesterase [Bacillaceae bacterium S4-13-58]
MDSITVLVVDDSAFMRKMITDMLEQDHRIRVVGTARNGQDGLKKIKELSPDVVTLDVEMPIMDGLNALQEIMKEHPLPVVMLSSVTKEGATSTFQAMEMGAIDFVLKTSGAISLDIEKVQNELINKVIAASKTDMNLLLKPISKVKMNAPKESQKCKELYKNKISHAKKIVAIGTSTGGPRALQQVLTQLPATIEAPILVVQHMPPGFTRSLAERLNSLCKITVKEAENEQVLENGVAYIAPGNFHLKVKQKGVQLLTEINQAELVNGHRPSVDVLFDSIARISNYEKIAVIMTGMGSDGAKSLYSLKTSGQNSTIISESQETSVVFGMPKAAINTKMVDYVVDLQNIGSKIVNIVENRR